MLSRLASSYSRYAALGLQDILPVSVVSLVPWSEQGTQVNRYALESPRTTSSHLYQDSRIH